MRHTRIIRVGETCEKAIEDIRAYNGFKVSKITASEILGENYFKLKKSKKPFIVWDTRPV